MFAGHVGAAFAIAGAERRVNLGVFVAAAVFLDALLWLLVVLGWESVSIPADFASSHQPEFAFPYSHGLAASLVSSALVAIAAWTAYARLGPARRRAAALLSAAVFSHWLLDALVHRPELPLVGADSAKVGLGLWQNMPSALALEAAILAAGLILFVRASGLPRGKTLALAAFSLVILASTVVGMTIAPAPPSVQLMAATSLVILVVVCALASWLGRLPGAK